MNKTSIGFMIFYKRLGRVIFIILFALALAATVTMLVKRSNSLFLVVLLDAAIALAGVYLEATMMRYRELGTIFIQSGSKIEKVMLEEFQVKGERCFVDQTYYEYTVKIAGSSYMKGYKKDEVSLVEDPEIEWPFLEITIVEKEAAPSGNEYSVFVQSGDKIKTETPKIVVRNIVREVNNAV